MASSPPSPQSPVLRSAHRRQQHSQFYLQARSLSELALHNLSLADMFEARYSEVTDEDLLDSFAPLGTGVVEEAEQMFHDRCHQALEYAATPSRSPTAPAPSAVSSPPRSSCSSSASRSRSMADRSDPSYFALEGRGRLYSDGGESSYSSGISTPSLWTDDAVSSYAESGYGSPLPSTPASERQDRLTYSCTGSPSLTAADLNARSSPPAYDLTSDGGPAPATIATRRSGLSLKLEMPPMKPLPSSASIATLRDRAPGALLSRAAKSHVAEPALSPLSAPSSPRMASTVSALSHLTVAAGSGAAETSSPEENGTKKPTWLLDLEQQVAPTDGIKLKRKPSHVYAF
ncbi:hypothetical protein JCM10908_004344 [Rhodotorula pacifica]|uniref:uncharacterized protein n=1 Tax=Rhodotorula pacifica TaxID=1495444 RepID=UPI00316DC6FC